MARTSKSPSRVLRTAYRIAQRTLPAYSHPCSPKKFTQHQLFACLALKEFFRLDYRGVEVLLAEDAALRSIIDLLVAPDFTTLQKACARLLKLPICNRLLDETVHWARKTPLLTSPVALAAIDSSGFEAHRVSNYFVRRRAGSGENAGIWRTVSYRRFPKLGLVVDCSSNFILAAVPHRGPSPDFDHWSKAMKQARGRVRIKTLLADAGYDAEWIHVAARIVFDTRTLIPPKHGRPTDKLPRQYFRRRMARTFQHRHRRKPYRQRAQIETVFSQVKRRLDSSVNAHSYWSQCRALMLKALVHNIMLLRRKQVFDRAGRESNLTMCAQAIDATQVKYVAKVSPVREVALLGTADSQYWREPLERAEVLPLDESDRVPILIGATDTRFHGIRFRELTVTVFCRDRRGSLPDGVFIARAYNSVRWFAWVERNIFATPYDHGVAEVMLEPAASFQLTVGGAVALRATMSVDRSSQRAAEHAESDGFAGPVYLPRRKPNARLNWFYASIAGETDTFPFDPAHDSLSLRPTAGQPVIQALIDSHFAADRWAVRSAATHKKSKTYRRPA